MKKRRRMLACLSLAFVLLFAACGGRQSVASRSAAAYDEAKRKGIPIGGGHEHGGHAAGDTTASSGGSEMPGMDHSTMQGGTMTRMDHSKMQSGSTPAMGHSMMQSGRMPGMEHSKMQGGGMAGMQHGGASAAAVPTPRSATDLEPIDPAATLGVDPFDTPSLVSVSEALKANNVADGDIRHIVPGQDHENPPTPQPAFRDGTGQAGHARDGRTVPATPATAAPDHSAHGGSTSAGASQKPAETAVYTCPMHPDVTSDKPGTCPKCGMALVKKRN